MNASLSRPRKRKYSQLPPGVYFDRCRFVLRRLDGVPIKPPVRLAPGDAPLEAVWLAYSQHIGKGEGTLEWLCEQFTTSPKWEAFKPLTKYAWGRYKRNICNARFDDGTRLGSVYLYEITPGLLRNYLDLRPRVMGNREISFLSAAFKWGISRDLVKDEYGKVAPNPCKGVERNKEGARVRYVSDLEYKTLLEAAPVKVQIAMELAYLCRMRRGEILSAKKSQILKNGFDTLRTKGSKDAVTLWSTRLETAIACAENLPGIDSVYLIHDRRGQPVKETTLNAAWQKVKRETGITDVTFHDLKAKGISDFQGSKKDAGGHKTEAMVLVYDRKKLVVKPTR